jgi:UDP-glucose:(heptosyl)LPS alpha-1,3-glucosyltransferase
MAARAARPFAFDRLARRALVRLGPFDVVHGFGKTSRQDVYRDGSGCLADFQAAAFENQGLAWLAPLRRLGPQAIATLRIERERYRPGSCRFVLPISALVRDQILRRYDLPPERVRVLHPAVDTARFTPRLAPAARVAVRAELGLPAAAAARFVGSDFGARACRRCSPRCVLPGVHAWCWRTGRAPAARASCGELGGRPRLRGPAPGSERLLAAATAWSSPAAGDAFGNACWRMASACRWW